MIKLAVLVSCIKTQIRKGNNSIGYILKQFILIVLQSKELTKLT